MYKYLLSISFIISISYLSSANLYLNTSTTTINGSTANLNPGDTIFVQGGQRNWIELMNIDGSSSAPIVIINKDSISTIISNQAAGIKISNCSFLKITGTGTSAKYGFNITSNDIGIQATGGWSGTSGTTDVEITNVEIHHCNVGILYKSTKDRTQFIQRNTIVANSYFHHIDKEAIYLGSSFYASSNDHLLKGVWVYNNVTDSTGWDGIQVGSAVDSCYVYNNIVLKDSYLNAGGQNSGIMLNPGSKCDCYNNFIKDGKGPGIFDQGLGENKIYNNVIINAGLGYNSSNPRGGDGIAIWGGTSRPYSAGNSIYVFHNTIVNPKNNGITFAYDPNVQGDSSIIANNIIVGPKGTYWPDTLKAFVEAYLSASFLDVGNYKKMNPSLALFVNPSIDDYHLQITSPAYGLAVPLAFSEQLYDYDTLQRSSPYTPGAFRLVALTTTVIDKKIDNDFQLFLESDNQIHLKSENNKINTVQLFDITGREIKLSQINNNTYKFNSELSTGIYFININNMFGIKFFKP